MRSDPVFDGLPFLMQPDVVARYEPGAVHLLDRRRYPFVKQFVVCRTYSDVARAITDMVTQSSGPRHAAAMGMVLAAHSARGQHPQIQLETLRAAARVLGDARPTNDNIRIAADEMLRVGETAISDGDDGDYLENILLACAHDQYVRAYAASQSIGRHAADVLQDGDTILTHCWPETGLAHAVLAAQAQGKTLQAICSETRPYLQGARLTADALSELGVSTTVITEGMQAAAMSQGLVSTVLTGADRVTMSGHVVNKVGTLQTALSAAHFGIPLYAFTRGPDRDSPGPADVTIENRDGDDVLHCLGVRTAAAGVEGFYPAFDVTPPDLITGLITTAGVLAPHELEESVQHGTP